MLRGFARASGLRRSSVVLAFHLGECEAESRRPCHLEESELRECSVVALGGSCNSGCLGHLDCSW